MFIPRRREQQNGDNNQNVGLIWDRIKEQGLRELKKKRDYFLMTNKKNQIVKTCICG